MPMCGPSVAEIEDHAGAVKERDRNIIDIST